MDENKAYFDEINKLKIESENNKILLNKLSSENIFIYFLYSYYIILLK